MKYTKKKDKFGNIIWIVVGSVSTIVGIFIIPFLIKKYGNKAYKKSLKTEEIDFDEMGPEIVPFNEETKEE